MSEPAMGEAAINEKCPGRHIGRSIVALLAGMIAGIALS
jgi:hypothetical protein